MPELICPLCRERLHRDGPAWRCAAGHAFDIAREGYVNLLPVQHKHSKAPGDNPEMVVARREFLDAGHYAPLRERLLAMIRTLRPDRMVDIGCGEGYYTGAFAEAVSDLTGLDIAKPAVRLAAKRIPRVQWIVGSGALLPLADGSVDLVTSLFSPLPVQEMRRVLRPEGRLLVATPSPDHLWNIREALFGEVRPHEPAKFIDTLAAAFRLENTEEVRTSLELSQHALRQLLMMTPYVWKARPEQRQALEAHATWRTEASFTIMQFVRV